MSEKLERIVSICDAEIFFALKGPLGGVHFHMRLFHSARNSLAGFEIHSPKPIYGEAGKPPDNEKCWLIEGQCYHDGSSSIGSAMVEQIQSGATEQEIWERLEAFYKRNLSDKE